MTLGSFRKLQRNSALAKESQPRPWVLLVGDAGDNRGSCRDLGWQTGGWALQLLGSATASHTLLELTEGWTQGCRKQDS